MAMLNNHRLLDVILPWLEKIIGPSLLNGQNWGFFFRMLDAYVP